MCISNAGLEGGRREMFGEIVRHSNKNFQFKIKLCGVNRYLSTFSI